jgi:hypothetical protein
VVTTPGVFASAHNSTLFVHMSYHSRTLLYVDDMIITQCFVRSLVQAESASRPLVDFGVLNDNLIK